MQDHAEFMPNEAPEETQKDKLEELREHLDLPEDTYELVKEQAEQGNEKAQLTLQIYEHIEDFFEETMLPLAEDKQEKMLEQAQKDFMREMKRMIKESGALERKEQKQILSQIDELLEFLESGLEENFEAGWKQKVASELWYLVPFAGPATMVVESKVGWTLDGRRLDSLGKRKLREAEGSFWLLADCTGAGELGRFGKATWKGGRLAAKTLGKHAGVSLSKGVFRRTVTRGAGKASHKVGEGLKLAKSIQNEGGLTKGLIMFGKKARRGEALMGDAAWTVGHTAADQLMGTRDKLAASIDLDFLEEEVQDEVA